MQTETIHALGRDWEWPIDDTKLRQVIDYAKDIAEIMQHVPEKRRDACIQAGGACGVWPVQLSNYFKCVLTFEPHSANYHCLLNNIDGIPQIAARQAALHLHGRLKRSLALPESEQGNAGAHYTVRSEEGVIDLLAIDELGLVACDLIQLDVEGDEYDALLGGEKTLKKFRPVVVIEEKELPQLAPGAQYRARGYLNSLGYEEAGRVHRDVIFKHAEV